MGDPGGYIVVVVRRTVEGDVWGDKFQVGRTRGGLRASGGRKDPPSVSTSEDDSVVRVKVSMFICSGALLDVVEAMVAYKGGGDRDGSYCCL